MCSAFCSWSIVALGLWGFGLMDYNNQVHGIGTPTGDPIETTAVGKVIRETGIYIGSVKPNLGHGGGSSVVTSVIKSILVL
jgi:acyl transferase domain-containing protein